MTKNKANLRFYGNRFNLFVLGLAAALIVTIVAIVRWGDTSLGNDFILVRDKGEWYIIGPIFDHTSTSPHIVSHALLVSPTIARFYKYQNIVTGTVEFAPRNEYSDSASLGFFVLDVNTGEVHLSLSEQEWAEWLVARGVDPITIAMRPTWLRVSF